MLFVSSGDSKALAFVPSTYPVAPEDLDLAIGNDDAVEPVAGAHNEDEDVSSRTEIRAESHHEQSEEDLENIVNKLALHKQTGGETKRTWKIS